jgi:hypothetical protein
MTQVNDRHWGQTSWEDQDFNQTFTFLNNRIQKPNWLFDEDGRVTKSVSDQNEETLTTFDALGHAVRTTVTGQAESMAFYDGDGEQIKLTSSTRDSETGVWTTEPTKYYIRSTVMGGAVVSEVWSNGKKHRSIIKSIGNQTAVQTAYSSTTAQLNETVIFEYSDAMGMSYRTVDENGDPVASGDGGEGSPIETDPLGGSVGLFSPYLLTIPPYNPNPRFPDLKTFNLSQEPEQMFSFNSLYSLYGSRIADLPGFGTNWGTFAELGEHQYEESVQNATHGFNPNEHYGGRPGAKLRSWRL